MIVDSKQKKQFFLLNLILLNPNQNSTPNTENKDREGVTTLSLFKFKIVISQKNSKIFYDFSKTYQF